MPSLFVAGALCALLSASVPATTTATTAVVAPEGPPVGTQWLVLPIAKYNDDSGLTYGIHFPIVYRDGVSSPYLWFFEIKLRHSTKNRHEHFLLFDWTDLLGMRFRLQADVLHIDNANYFGRARTERLEHPEDKVFQSQMTEPRVQTLLSDKFEGNFFWGAGLSFNYTHTRYTPESLLAQLRPLGIDGGHGLIGLLVLGYDSRETELDPREGVYVEAYAKAASRPLGSSHSFQGVGLTLQGYYAIFRWLVLAQRIMFEDLGGAVPFYEQNRIGGRNNVFALGGVFSQRGFLEARFTGNTKFLANSEVRLYSPKFFDWVTVGLGGFFDLSAILDDARFSDLDQRFKPSVGGEITVKWKELVLFRVDVGLSTEGVLTYIEGRHLF